MIVLENVSKSVMSGKIRRNVALDINLRLQPGQTLALLGRNGAGKSMLMQMIAGLVLPDRGRIRVSGSVSWPVGFNGSFHRDLSGAQNARFLARVYGIDTGEYLDFVQGFSELGDQFHSPVRGYSSGMRSRLGFACSMGMHFDAYLIDEITAVGDARFRRKCDAILQERLAKSAALFVSHNLEDLRRICCSGAVLENGKLDVYGSLEKAIDLHERHLKYG